MIVYLEGIEKERGRCGEREWEREGVKGKVERDRERVFVCMPACRNHVLGRKRRETIEDCVYAR